MMPEYPDHWTEGEVNVGGAALHYYRAGDRSKPSLILQHGFSDDGLCWMQTALDLEGEYDILMPDARGHGLSARVEPGQPIDMAGDLVEVIRILGLSKPVIAGHSMGGMIAGQIGSRFPDVPRALILEDPPWRLPPVNQPQQQPGDRGHPMADFVKSLAQVSAEELMTQARLEHPTWSDTVIQTWCSAKKRLDPNILTTSPFRLEDWLESIPLITCPALLFSADPEQGGIVTPREIQEIRQRNSGFTFAPIPGVGHHIRFGNYNLYMEHFCHFLEDLKP